MKTGRWRRPPFGVERLRGLDPRRIMTPQTESPIRLGSAASTVGDQGACLLCIIYEPEK